MYSDQMKIVRPPAAQDREERLKTTRAQARASAFFMEISLSVHETPPADDPAAGNRTVSSFYSILFTKCPEWGIGQRSLKIFLDLFIISYFNVKLRLNIRNFSWIKTVRSAGGLNLCTKETESMNKIFKSFKLRLIFLCIMTLVAVMALIHAAVYTTTKNSIEEQLKMGARGVAVSTANTIMGSIDEYKEFLETKDVNSEYYQRMRGYFTDVKENGNIKYIYTERRIDAHTVEFILDAEPVDSPGYSPPGSLNANDEFRESAYSTRHAVGFSRLVNYSMWGKLIGAYAPIFDRNGEMLGLIGINIDASNLYSHLNRLQMMMLLIYLLIIGLVLLVLMKYSNAILEPVLKDKLTGA
jgi:hypothetical protein